MIKINNYAEFMAEAEKFDPEGFAKARAERAESDAPRKDAERYRWLRDAGSLTWVPFRSQWKMDATQCDAAIDAEMQRQKAFW